MFLIICDPEDLSALWFARQLDIRGVSVGIVIPDELIIHSVFSLSINSSTTSAEVCLESGQVIDANSVIAIFNRSQSFPVPVINQPTDEDIVYSAEEVRAAVVAWFHAIECPVFCPPSPYSPAGENISDLIWRFRASQLNIPTKSMTVGAISDDISIDGDEVKIMLFDTQIVSTSSSVTPSAIVTSIKRLASIYSPGCITCRFYVNSTGTWLFLGTDTLPDLSLFGNSLLNTVSQWIENGE